MLDDLLKRQVLIVLGKGGVGKTTVSAALSLVKAADSARVLAVEYDRLGAMAGLFGRSPSLDAVETVPGVWTLVLDGAHQLAEYLATVVPSRTVLRAVVASRIYRYFVDAAPGLRELITVGKPLHELERRPAGSPAWDLIVMDAPATGQALGMLRMPLAAHETFAASIVGREAQNVAKLLRDKRRCGVVLVTSPEPLAIKETLETHSALKELGLDVAAIMFNRARAPRFTTHDVTRMSRRAGLRASVPHLDDLAGLARTELRRAAVEHRACDIVRGRTGAPLVEIAECRGKAGLNLAKEVAAQLAHRRGTEPRARVI